MGTKKRKEIISDPPLKEKISEIKPPKKFFKSFKELILLVLIIAMINFSYDFIIYLFSNKKTVSVSRVIDGDTFKGVSKDYRLVGINSPERGRYGYEEAGRYLTFLITQLCPDDMLGSGFFKDVEIVNTGKGRFGRELVYVSCNGESINERMIQEGYAISYRKYPHKHTDRYNDLEKKAKNNRRGLWSYWLTNGYNAY